MKKIIMTIAIASLISGCSMFQPTKVQVWTPPKFEMPVRPQLTCDGTGTDGEVARKLSIDMLNMTEYTKKLENLLNTLKTQSNGQNNK